MEHTKGPWHIDDELGSLVIRNGGLVADIGPANKEANSKLMAASPVMLEALEAAHPLLLLALHEYRKRNDRPAMERYSTTAEAVETAIEAATGEGEIVGVGHLQIELDA